MLRTRSTALVSSHRPHGLLAWLCATLLALLLTGCPEGHETPWPGDDVSRDVLGGDTAGGDTTQPTACSEGEHRPAGDGCNTCTCLQASWSCTRMACGPAGVCPAPAGTDEPCAEAIVIYAQDPQTSACCRYTNACDAPPDWARFFSQQECEAACEPGATRVGADGCNTCVCTTERGWQCTEHTCPDDNTCQSDADCVQTGCHDEVCAADTVETTCDWSDANTCYAEPTTACGCQDGVCGFAPTPELGACLDELAWCRPGDIRSAQDGCNLCWCTSDGTWACGERDCRVCPGEAKDARPCAGGEVWARDPVGGLCCRYSDACMAPNDWALYESAEECENSGCEPGATRPARDGCNSCVCEQDGRWSCTTESCAVQSCQSDADCLVTGCNGELCAAEHLYTSCEWDPAFACYAEPFTGCGCRDGVCGWSRSDALELCIMTARP